MTPSPAYLNTYVPRPRPSFPPNIHLETPVESYDLNFVFSPIKVLQGSETDVRLEPFVPSIHAQQIFDATVDHPELFRWMPIPLWTTIQGLLEWAEEFHRTPASSLLYVIYDTKGDNQKGTLAGFLAFINSSEVDLVSELGWVCIIPSYQRTHVLTHTAFLMLEHAFVLPSSGGWGLRRVQWQANELNLPSLRAAGRLGFSDEGRIVHQRVLNAGLVGSYPGRTGDAHQGRDSRTTAVFGMGYHQWAGIRERLQEMVRKTY